MTAPALPAALGPALAAAAVAAAIARSCGGSRAFRAALAAAGAAAVFLPAGGLPLWGYFRGVAGEASATTLALLAVATAAAAGWGRILGRGDVAALAAAAALAGLVLYPSAAGAVPLDVYRLGWRPFGLVCGVLAFSLWAWATGRRGAALVSLAALAAFDCRALESRNLWDYLLDPFLVLFSWGWWIVRGARGIARRGPENH